jgi:uncharacterized membrane protein YdjX (TVP38/TMEM64 family)
MNVTEREAKTVPRGRSEGFPQSASLAFARSVLRILLIILLLVAVRLVLDRYLDQSDLRRFVQLWGVIAPIGFILLSAIVVLLFIPPVVSLGLGALSFGSALGAFYSLIGLTVGACLAFLVGRYCTIAIPLGLKARRPKARLERVYALMTRNALLTIIGLRLALYCYPPLNYLVGSTSVTMRDYLFGTLFGLIPQTFALSYVLNIVVTSASFAELLENSQPSLLLAPCLIRVLGLVVLITMARRYRRGAAREEETND